MLQCPLCGIPLITVEYEQVELDICSHCHGTWLDVGELELLLEGQTEALQGLLETAAPPQRSERPRRCPVCRSRMVKATVGADGGMMYDRCPRDHGIWLDAGELEAMLEHGGAVPGCAPIARYLRGMFRGTATP